MKRNQKPPHVLATIESESMPEFRYEKCPYNPLRIIVRTPEGEILPERSIIVVQGSRDALLKDLKARELRRKEYHEQQRKLKSTRGPSLEWAKEATNVPQ